MIAVPIALLFLAPAAGSAEPVKPAESECERPATTESSDTIVICAQKPHGYRLDPDVLAARRLKKQGETVRPRNPHEALADHSCATVGPMGCRGQPTIDFFTAGAALATMAQRLASGQEIGSMFKTQPASTEYQLYLRAKHQREEEEAVKAANRKAAEARAAAERATTSN